MFPHQGGEGTVILNLFLKEDVATLMLVLVVVVQMCFCFDLQFAISP